MTFFSNNIAISLLLLTLLSATLTACGGNREALSNESTTSSASAEQSGDITSPPIVSKDVQAEPETNPEETISFDEWRRRRQLEQQVPEQ